MRNPIVAMDVESGIKGVDDPPKRRSFFMVLFGLVGAGIIEGFSLMLSEGVLACFRRIKEGNCNEWIVIMGVIIVILFLVLIELILILKKQRLKKEQRILWMPKSVKVVAFIHQCGFVVAACVFTSLSIWYFTGNMKDEGNAKFIFGKTSVVDAAVSEINFLTLAVIVAVFALWGGHQLHVNFMFARHVRDDAPAPREASVIQGGTEDNYSLLCLKLIYFQLTVIVAALLIDVVAGIFSGDVPITSVELLWLIFITGSLGAFALASEPPMHSVPNRVESFFTNQMWISLISQVLLQVVLVLVLHFGGSKFHHFTTKQLKVFIFNTFVSFQIFNALNARIEPDKKNIFQGLSSNWLFLLVCALAAGFQFVVAVVVLGLSFKLWAVSSSFSSSSLLVAVIVKYFGEKLISERPFAEYLADIWKACVGYLQPMFESYGYYWQFKN